VTPIPATSQYDGTLIVQRSIDLGTPVIFVSMNYRLSGIGFLASKEVNAAGVGNLGLQDQRLALRWIQKYIPRFGGDRTKVTLWGESAGATSASLHMLTNGGNPEGLFRGVFMNSGGPIQTDGPAKIQNYYDAIVENVGCSSASDTLACLRTVSWESLTAAINLEPNVFSYSSLHSIHFPRVDGVFLTAPPMELVRRGGVANVPFVTGDCDDEGTLFTIALRNITTDAEFRQYVKQNYFPSAPQAQIDQIANAYPDNPILGSPFGTGTRDQLSPQYKRLAAFQGDLKFQSVRRFFLQQRSSFQNTWSFLYNRNKYSSEIGSFHGSDLIPSFHTGGDLQDYVIAFSVTLDPNSAGYKPSWPKWKPRHPTLLAFLNTTTREITSDTYRQHPIEILKDLSERYPV